MMNAFNFRILLIKAIIIITGLKLLIPQVIITHVVIIPIEFLLTILKRHLSSKLIKFLPISSILHSIIGQIHLFPGYPTFQFRVAKGITHKKLQDRGHYQQLYFEFNKNALWNDSKKPTHLREIYLNYFHHIMKTPLLRI